METRRSGRATASPPYYGRAPSELRAEVRRLRLHGAARYACRRCRAELRVVSARHLPESCSSCGTGTWTEGGLCALTPGCPGRHPAGRRQAAHCATCGAGVWRRLGID
jgi:hypothetical protein